MKKINDNSKLEQSKLNKKNSKSFYKTKNPSSIYDSASNAFKQVSKSEVEFSDEWNQWWDTLSEELQKEMAAIIGLLEERGTTLGSPYSSKIKNSKLSHLRELRIQHKGRPYRILYVFAPRRVAILLVGDKKTDDKKWYIKNIRLAEQIYEAHLHSLKEESVTNG